MSSTQPDSSPSFYNIHCCIDKNLSDLSPVTDLAFNLKSLKTVTGTPTRRISWTDPYSNNNPAKYIGDLSPSADSPMIQEIFKKNVKKKKDFASRNAVPLYIDEEKENMDPGIHVISGNSNKTVTEKNSRDSGYGSVSSKKSNSMKSTPFRVKSSLFNSNLEEDGLFPMEDDIEIDSSSEFNMKSLLTKPLCNVTNSANTVKRDKLPIRRCLTMEMESNSDSLSANHSLSNQSDMSFASISEKNDCSMSIDIEPLKRLPFKRPDESAPSSWQCKRRRSSPSVCISSESKTSLIALMKQRSFSETAATIMQAVQKADLQPDLIGDCSRNYALPLVQGRHQDLKSISPQTLAQLIKGEYKEKVDAYTLVDCRYPYEFEGGHIQGAENIYTKEDIMQKFLENIPVENDVRNVIVFHCEFSSERAPNLSRFLRNKDREINECNYPRLHHPEIYLLEGGYKAFYANFQEFCVPQDYKPMNHKDHNSDLRFFRSKSKSWGSDSKSLYKIKSANENSRV